jgi:hypothetical protein
MAIKELKINKRPRYFAGQYLLEDDFELEQDYARDRLQRYTRSLHVAGIADGLIASKPNDATLKLAVDISAGMAIDPQGRQVVSIESRQVDLSKDLAETVALNNGDYILYIGYDEQESEPQDGSANTNRRILENPRFKLSSSATSDDFIAIAKLTIKDGVVSIASDSNSVRKYTGLRLPSSSDNPLTLRSGDDRASNLAVLSGSLSVEGSLSVTGNVGIGTASQGAKLEVKGDTNDYNAAALNVTDSKSKSLLYVRNDGNVGIGTTDPKQQLVVNSGKASIGYNDVQQTAAFAVNGNIGIGTTTPTEKLEISGGNLKVSGNISATAVNFPQTFGQRLTLWSSDYGIGLQGSTQYFRTYQNFAWYKGGSHNDGSLNPGGGTVQMVINNGNVGIGTSSPAEKLEISGGNLKVSGNVYATNATLTGNVGIGTTSPDNAKLQVQIDGATTAASLKLEHNGSNFIVRPFSAGGTSSVIENTASGSLLINPNGGKVGIGTKSEPTHQNLVLSISAEKGGYGEIQAAQSSSSYANLILNRQGGNVGIGTAEPSFRLNVDPNGLGGILIGNPKTSRAVGSGYTNLVLSISAEKGGYGEIQAIQSSGSLFGSLILNRQGGNVGIGTAEPSARLNVNPNEPNGGILIGNPEANLARGGYTGLLLSISAEKGGYGEIQAIHSSGSHFGYLILNRQGGKVVIGTQNPDPNSTLDVNGTITHSGISGRSDIRWKKNIETIASALDKVLQLRGVTFEWRKEEYQEMNFNSGKHLGLIAQEVEQVIPEVVHQNDEGYKSLAYSNLVALSIEALKELQAKHENLLPTMQAQQAEIEGLKTELNRLKALLITQPV